MNPVRIKKSEISANLHIANWNSYGMKKYGVGLFCLIFLFFGASFSTAFIEFFISPESLSFTLSSLESASSTIAISTNPSTPPDEGEFQPYWIDLDVVDGAPDLCQYIALEPESTEDTPGQLTLPIDDTDNWILTVTSPESLPEALQNETFRCRLSVYFDDSVFPTRVLTKTAYAAITNEMEVSAVLTGEENIPTCCSSVLFLPGLEASRLYKQKTVLGLPSEDQLWEPNGNSDIEDLYLNTDGSSINSTIYTRDIIKESNTPVDMGVAGQNIYKSFSTMMDGLVTADKITEWKSYAYDWRQDVRDIVDNGTPYQNGKVSLVETLQSLVDSSKNGKVSVITHSNGGLLAKALLVKLESLKATGASELIDHIDMLILVAPPQIGTASAVPGILHGFNQQILNGWLLDEMHARELARNMLGAYGLLPSREYINRVSASPVIFTDNFLVHPSLTTPFIDAYGNVIDNYTEYKSFLFGAEGRAQPAVGDEFHPINLSSSLFNQAESLHDTIDAWTPPSSLKVIEVAGWGLDTIASFEYYSRAVPCNTQTAGCLSYVLDERPIFTSDGDKTVVVPSAHYMEGEKVWVNLPAHNRDLRRLRRNREHKDILEVNEVDDFISALLNKETPTYDLVLSNTEPTDTTNRLRISIHSPVSIGAYDKDGNFTGKVCPANSDFCFAKEDIPNSSYMEFGEGKYLNLPEESLDNVVLEGTDTGTFTYESTKVMPSGVSTTTMFVDIPVTSETKATVTLGTANLVPQLALDVDGDGKTDFTIKGQQDFDPILFLQIMRKTIEGFNISKDKREKLYKRIDDTIKAIQKGKIAKAKLKVEKFRKSLIIHPQNDKDKHEKNKYKKLSQADADLLITMLNQLLDNLNK